MSKHINVIIVAIVALLAGLGGGYLLANAGTNKEETSEVSTKAQARPAVTAAAEAQTATAPPDAQVAAAAPAVAAKASASSAPVQPAVAVAPVAAAAPAVAVAPALGDMSSLYGKKFNQVQMAEKKIALTFDDGPYPNTTPELLAILKKEGVKATFFMLGSSVANSPAVAKAVADEGHEIGCHTFNHPDLRKKGVAEIQNEITSSIDAIQTATGKRPMLFRPPFGNVNANVLNVAKESKVVIINWSIDPQDWNVKRSADQIQQKVTLSAQPGAIVCMHDTRPHTIAAVPGIIADLKAKGYQIVTVSELLGDFLKSGGSAEKLTASGAADANPVPANQPLVIDLDKTASN